MGKQQRNISAAFRDKVEWRGAVDWWGRTLIEIKPWQLVQELLSHFLLLPLPLLTIVVVVGVVVADVLSSSPLTWWQNVQCRPINVWNHRPFIYYLQFSLFSSAISTGPFASTTTPVVQTNCVRTYVMQPFPSYIFIVSLERHRCTWSSGNCVAAENKSKIA